MEKDLDPASKNTGTLTEVRACRCNNEDAETAGDLPRLPSLQQSKSVDRGEVDSGDAADVRSDQDASMCDSDGSEEENGDYSVSDGGPEFRYSEKKAEELGAVLSGLSCPFATSFTLKTNAANLPVVQVQASGAASSSDNAPAAAFRIRAPTVPAADPPASTNRGSVPFYAESAREREAEQKKRTAILEEQKARLQPLLSQMPQAAFGHGTETKRDTTVRDALQLPAEKFQVKVGGVPLADYLKESGALAKIQSALQIETGIDIELYSLNVYQQGGHFVKHKDTPRGDDMLGTLVVGLGGCYYEGGAMTISAGLQSKKVLAGATAPTSGYSFYSSGPSKVQLPDPTSLHCAAFFSDIDHEIAKVTSGVRMTVAFLIKRSDKSSAASLIPRQLTQSEQEKKLADMLRELLHNKKFLANGGTVGFPCFHLYTNSEVFPGKDSAADRALTRQQIQRLKGKDAAIGRAVDTVQRKVGGDLEFFLTPYLTHEYCEEGDYLLSRFPVGTKVPRRMDDDKIACHFKAIGDACDGHAHEMVDVWALDGETYSHDAKFAGQTEWNAEGYFGNEASDVAFYVKSFLRLVFPPYPARKDAGPAAAPTPARKNVPKAGKGSAGAAKAPQGPYDMVLSQEDDDEPPAELQRDPEEVTEVGVGKITALWKKLSSAQAGITFDESDEYLSDDAFLKKRAKDLDKPATSSDLKVMAALEQELKKQVADPLFLQKGGLLMFPCQSTYSSAGLFPRAKVMTAAQKKAKDDEFRSRLMKATAHGSSAAPPLAEAAAPPAMKKATTKSAREVLDKKQIEKLKSAEKLVALAAEKAGLSMKFRIYETDDNDDPYGDEPFEHAILSTFPPKLPKSMSKNDFFCRVGTYEPGDEDLYLGTFDSGKIKKTQHWIAEFEHGAEERFTTEFKKKKKMGKMKSKKGGLGGAFGFGDWSDDSFSDDDSDFGFGGGGMFGFGGGMFDEPEPDLAVLIYRTALMVIVPAAEKRTTGVSSSSSSGGQARGAANDAGAAPKENAGSKASPVDAKAKAKAAGAAPKAKAQSKAAKAGAPKAKAKPAKAKAKAVPKQAAEKMKTVKKK